MCVTIYYHKEWEIVPYAMFYWVLVYVTHPNVFIWKISWQYFGVCKSSICLKDQLTILQHYKFVISIWPSVIAQKICVFNLALLSFRRKISWKYFGSGQSSICLKDQLTILRHHISERSKDTTLVWASQVFVWKINWQYFGSG